jgi:hypothetical protein
MVKMKNTGADFMALDESDFMILPLLIKRSAEFPKLEFSDQEVLLWFLMHSPNRVKSWIDYLDGDYHNKRVISIDGPKLYDEIKDLL